ncbi:MAG TPA: hypothetical protein VF391_07250, partial [Dermatophilaceae bacterium]
RRRQDRGVRDTELYRHLLGLVAPWEVSQVELSVEDGRVDVWVEHPKRTRFLCPDCDVELAVYEPLRGAGMATSGLVCVLDLPACQYGICQGR